MINMEKTTATKWIPTTDLMQLRRFGKMLEELGELTEVASRCIIQGIDELDPSTQRMNRVRLTDEIADVYAQLDETIEALELNSFYIEKRRAAKRAYMQEWEEMFK